MNKIYFNDVQMGNPLVYLRTIFGQSILQLMSRFMQIEQMILILNSNQITFNTKMIM